MANNLKDFNSKLLQEADFVYLATIDKGGFPNVRAMANMRNSTINPSAAKAFEGHENDFLMYFSTHKSSDKVKHIQINPAASAYFCDAKTRCGMLLLGKIDIVSDEKIKKEIWQDRWVKHFSKGLDDPQYTVLRLVPSIVKTYSPQGPVEIKLK